MVQSARRADTAAMTATSTKTWMGVEPRHLASFVAVAETGSFRRAATRLGYVQSAVSQQIAQLELALGAELLERGQGNRKLALTAAGVASSSAVACSSRASVASRPRQVLLFGHSRGW